MPKKTAKPKRRAISLYIEPETVANLALLANKLQRSIASVVRLAVQEYLKEHAADGAINS